MGARDHSADLCRLLAGQRPDEMALTPVSWPDLVAAARHEGVVHLLYRQLDATGWPPSAPPGLREELRNGYLASAAANLLVFRELARILAAFEHGSVDPPSLPSSLKAPPWPPPCIPHPACGRSATSTCSSPAAGVTRRLPLSAISAFSRQVPRPRCSRDQPLAVSTCTGDDRRRVDRADRRDSPEPAWLEHDRRAPEIDCSGNSLRRPTWVRRTPGSWPRLPTCLPGGPPGTPARRPSGRAHPLL